MDIIFKDSPNFDDQTIEIKFCVLHYSALDLQATIDILTDPAKKVSAHFVIGEQGEVYQLVGALSRPAKRAWHAGVSKFNFNGQSFSNLNDYSVGIELINLNGNIFDYKDIQYNKLFKLLLELVAKYPILKDPARIIGHEEIAAERGKIDPGLKFDWPKLYKNVYPNLKHYPQKNTLLKKLIGQGFDFENFLKKNNPQDSANFNLKLEQAVLSFSEKSNKILEK